MKLSIFYEICGISESVINKIILCFVFKCKLKTEFPFREWNITLYVLNENFIKKKLMCSKKIPYKIKSIGYFSITDMQTPPPHF